MLTLLAKLFHALNSESSPRQIALAISLGFAFSLAPFTALQNVFIFLIVMLVRVHLGAFILSVIFFSGFSYLLSFLIVSLGEALLTAEALQTLFTGLYQLSFFKLAHWHHTRTLGALVIGIVFFIPLYFLTLQLIIKYRVHIKTFIEKFRVVKALKASKFYRVYLSISGQGV